MREYERFADRIAASDPGKTLDWGCGWGQITVLLGERNVDVSAYEWHPDYPDPAEAAFPHYPDLSFTRWAEPVKLPYDDASFDTVVGCGVLEHVHEPEESLDELHRILKPGGRLFIAKLPNRRSYLELIARRSGQIYYHGELENDTIYTKSSAREIVERHGFEVEDVRYANMLPLTYNRKLTGPLAASVWTANRALSAVPGLRVIATNVELEARKPR